MINHGRRDTRDRSAGRPEGDDIELIYYLHAAQPNRWRLQREGRGPQWRHGRSMELTRL
jgi:hypothetical protein